MVVRADNKLVRIIDLDSKVDLPFFPTFYITHRR